MRDEDSSAGADTLLGDERAIEGLPIRLVIAVVVGVAALGIMLTLLDGLGETHSTEVTVELNDELVSEGESVTIAVVTADGQPVEDAQLLVTGGSLPLSNGPVTLETGPNSHEAALTIGSSGADAQVAFRNGQTRGTLDIEVVPPSGAEYADQRANADLVVIDR